MCCRCVVMLCYCGGVWLLCGCCVAVCSVAGVSVILGQEVKDATWTGSASRLAGASAGSGLAATPVPRLGLLHSLCWDQILSSWHQVRQGETAQGSTGWRRAPVQLLKPWCSRTSGGQRGLTLTPVMSSSLACLLWPELPGHATE